MNWTLLSLTLSAALAAPLSSARDDLRSAIESRAQALEELVAQSDAASLRAFADEHLSPAMREGRTTDELVALLADVRARCRNAGGIDLCLLGEAGFRLAFETDRGAWAVEVQLEPRPPHRIDALVLVEDEVARPPALPPITWDTLEARLDEAEESGFAGAVLVVRDGAVVTHRGLGLADRARGVPNSTETVFAIGSTPIDFTKAAILKLQEEGRLSVADPITRFLPDVPADKRGIRLEHLMNGTSGLRNFHHVPGVDEDYDLTWIDRDTAVGRILSRPLLFAPGTGEAHSHSAWGLLAAVVEIASKQDYADYLRERFFEPAGMRRTGLYEESRAYADALAAGYGGNVPTPVNTPAHWGPTSWLVMGSGGMVSNPGDLYRWMQAIRSGGLLSEASQELYWTGSVLAGGNDRGFLCVYTEHPGGPGDLVILCSNSHASPNDYASALARALVRLVR